MYFNSLDFGIFLPCVFLLYWFVFKSIRHQNILLLVSSYFFYGWWDWRFLTLILFSSLVDFYVALTLSSETTLKNRKLLLSVSLFVNIGLLIFFKYYNFFLENFITAFSFFGYKLNSPSLNIILPVGISFYTFQTLSYSIDVYRRNLTPTKDFIAFSAFVSFFPQLVAGPIERASNLLPQFYIKRTFDLEKSRDGLRQILWGLFKKVVIADNCAKIVNYSFDNFDHLSGYTLLLGALFFSIQIYCDFSGYSDIAIGTARLFGFNLMKNFAFPYFSRDIAEFWRKWHISLSTWFRDYLYIPLGGSNGGLDMKIRNTFIIFIVSGFWHGANWTFLFWGLLNAFYFLPLLIRNKNRRYINDIHHIPLIPPIKSIIKILFTFFITTLAWVFFRSETIQGAFNYIINSLTKLNNFQYINETFYYIEKNNLKPIFIILIFFLVIEWINKNYEHGLSFLTKKNIIFRWSFYILTLLLIILWGGQQQDFIYFQF